MDIAKSTRHQRIIGQYGEMLICNWLSRSGFEVCIVDHTGIDIVAFDPTTDRRFGITVKSRTRSIGTENDSVNVFSYRKEKDDRQRTLDACQAFACEPWVGVYVEMADAADIYLTSLENYDAKYRVAGRAVDDWKMTRKHRQAYTDDPDVKHIRVAFHVGNWWSPVRSLGT